MMYLVKVLLHLAVYLYFSAALGIFFFYKSINMILEICVLNILVFLLEATSSWMNQTCAASELSS